MDVDSWAGDEFDDDFTVPLDISLGGKATDKAIELLAEGGVERLTLNTLAKAALYSPGHFHARVGGRAGMLDLIVARFAERWESRILWPPREEADIAWLPDTSGTAGGARCWHAVVEIAHGEARAGRLGPGRTIAELSQREHDYLYYLLSGHLGRRPSEEELLILQMTLHGLRAAMVAPIDPITPEAARGALRRLLIALAAG